MPDRSEVGLHARVRGLHKSVGRHHPAGQRRVGLGVDDHIGGAEAAADVGEADALVDAGQGAAAAAGHAAQAPVGQQTQPREARARGVLDLGCHDGLVARHLHRLALVLHALRAADELQPVARGHEPGIRHHTAAHVDRPRVHVDALRAARDRQVVVRGPGLHDGAPKLRGELHAVRRGGARHGQAAVGAYEARGRDRGAGVEGSRGGGAAHEELGEIRRGGIEGAGRCDGDSSELVELVGRSHTITISSTKSWLAQTEPSITKRGWRSKTIAKATR